jgi:hypothetical protein
LSVPSGQKHHSGGERLPERRFFRIAPVSPPVQTFPRQIQGEGALVPYDPDVDPHVRGVQIDVRPGSGHLPEPVRDGVLRLLRSVTGVGNPGVAHGGKDGDRLADRKDLRPRDLLHPEVEFLRRGGGESGKKQKDAVRRAQPQVRSVSERGVPRKGDAPGPHRDLLSPDRPYLPRQHGLEPFARGGEITMSCHSLIITRHGGTRLHLRRRQQGIRGDAGGSTRRGDTLGGCQ